MLENSTTKFEFFFQNIYNALSKFTIFLLGCLHSYSGLVEVID